jgi:hypothetical protein
LPPSLSRVLTLITVTGSLVNPDGSLPSGAMLFQLTNGAGVPTGMEDSSTHELVVPALITGIVYQGRLLWNSPGGGGYNPLVMYAVDDSTTLPTALVYTVTEKLALPAGVAQLGPWQFTPSHTAAGGTVDIGTQRPVP